MKVRTIIAALCCLSLVSYPAYADGLAKITPSQPPPSAAPPTAEQPKTTAKKVLTDAAVVAAIIAASIAFYKASSGGPCACPNHRARDGSRCGKRSAHDRSGGYDVTCFPHEVTKEMITGWRQENEK